VVAVDKISVLFVCMGNICRSPAAEGVFREHVRRAGLHGSIHIDSAGTIDYHTGSLPDERMRKAAARRGYRLDSKARQVCPGDFEAFDLLVAMDRTNLDDLRRIAGRQYEHVHLLGRYLATTGDVPSVPDPYYGGNEGFELVLDMIESACPQLLQHCLELRGGQT
jgi:protein-tyrosine phosphatase